MNWLGLSRQVESGNAEEAWTLLLDSIAEPAAKVVIPQDVAWRVFTKGSKNTKLPIRMVAGFAEVIERGPRGCCLSYIRVLAWGRIQPQNDFLY
jgi:hypothetical protein